MINKRPGYDPFFAKNPFSPADEFVFMGLVVRSCHFDVTACAEARRLDNYDEDDDGYRNDDHYHGDDQMMMISMIFLEII